MRNYLKNLAFHCQGNYHLMKRYLKNNITVPEVYYDGNYLCIGEALYPSCLYELKKPPFVIFYEGKLEYLQEAMVAVVGSRTPGSYGIQQTKHLVGHMKQSHVIVSGVARGIDTIAHQVAMDGATIGVLGCGLNVSYPYENDGLIQGMKHQHLVISEYPPDTKPLKYHFPFRNRIIAALSQTIYVMAARPKSGTMTTVNEALALNKRIVCLPYRIDDPCGLGCNQLIQEGAEVLLHD